MTTFFAGDELAASDLEALANPPLCKLVQTVVQPLANNTAVAITFGTSSTIVDSHGIHSESTNTSYVVPTVAGWYEVTGTLWMAASTFSQLLAVVRKNGSNIDASDQLRPATTSAASSVQVTATVDCNGSTDRIELFGLQVSGGSVNTAITAGFRSTLEVKYVRRLVT